MSLVLGESCRYVLAELLVAVFACATANAQTPHVRLEPGSVHTSTIEATRDDKKISLQFRSILVLTDFPGAKSGESAVQMIYDPESKLFEWRSFQTYQGYDAELEAKQFAKNSFVYLAPDRLVVFSSLMFVSQAAVWESTEHYDSMDQGQDSVMRFLEEHGATADTPWNARFKTDDLMKEIPRDFMEQCYNAMRIPPRIEELRRDEKHWIFKITGPNGNSAEVSLDDAFKVVGTKLIPRPAVIVEDSASVPTAVHAMRNGVSSRLEARELLLNIAHGCFPASGLLVLMLYDPTTKLFLWYPFGVSAYTLPKSDHLPDDTAAHFFQNSIFVITEDKIAAFSPDTETVLYSSARFASLQDAQQSVLSEIAKAPYAPAAAVVKQLPLDSLLVPMQYSVPKRTPPSWRSVTHEGGRWRLQLEWSAGPLKEATLFLDDGFNPVKADLTYATSRAKIGAIASWPLLPDAIRNLKADQLTRRQVEFKMADRSSSIHALKNGQPVSVQAYLIDIDRTGNMLAVYDPASRLFWCIYEPHDVYQPYGEGNSIGYYASQFEKGNSWLLVTDDKIVGFDAVSNNSFTGAQESAMRYASFSEALNYALTAIWWNNGMIRDGHVYFDLRLPPAFLQQRTPPYNVAPRYLGISESHGNWQLVLEGASGQQAIVTLGEGYEPARASFIYATPAQK